MSFIRRKKGIMENLSDALSKSCRMLGAGSMIILSSNDGFLIESSKHKVDEEIDGELLAGLLTLVWKTGKKVADSLGLGDLNLVRLATERKNIELYSYELLSHLIASFITDTNVPSPVIKEVKDRLNLKIKKIFGEV